MSWFNWINKNPFRSYVLIFILMVIPALLMYPAAKSDQTAVIWFLIGIVILANLIVLGIKK